MKMPEHDTWPQRRDFVYALQKCTDAVISYACTKQELENAWTKLSSEQHGRVMATYAAYRIER